MNPQIRLFGTVPYDRSAKARWILTELGVTFEDRWLDRVTREFDKPEYLKINPLGRVPALQIGDQTIFESGAICAYLADHFIEKGLAPAFSSSARADYQKWMYFASASLDTFQTRMMIIEDIPSGEVHTAKEAALFSDFQDGLVALEGVLSKSKYLVDGKFSAADVCVSYHLYFCALWPELNQFVTKHPNVVTYLERMKQMPSAVKANVFSYAD